MVRTTGRSHLEENEVEIYCRGAVDSSVMAAFDALAHKAHRSRNAHFLWLIDEYVKQGKCKK